MTQAAATRACEQCGQSFPYEGTTRRYCSERCRYRHKDQALRSNPERHARQAAQQAAWMAANVDWRNARRRERTLARRLDVPATECLHCAAAMPARKLRVYCSDDCVMAAWRKAKAAETEPRPTPAPRRRIVTVAGEREATSEASEQLASSPYELPAPDLGRHVPGVVCELLLGGVPGIVEHRHARLLHGLLSHAIGRDHDAMRPAFALVPYAHCRSQWAVWCASHDDARRLHTSPYAGTLFGRDVRVSLGLPHRVHLPRYQPGRYTVRIDTVTLVHVRSNGTHTHTVKTAPTAESLANTLTTTLARFRLGLEVAPADLGLALLSHETMPDRLHTGSESHWRNVDDGAAVPGLLSGWVGTVVVEVSAVGRTLLECARWMGLGGRVSLGLGRIAVRDVTDSAERSRAVGRFFVTPHAVERYRERIEPVAYDVALGRLIRASADARLAKRYPDGQALYRTGKPDRLAFVVAPCAEPGERSHAIVTVLGPPARSAT